MTEHAESPRPKKAREEPRETFRRRAHDIVKRFFDARPHVRLNMTVDDGTYTVTVRPDKARHLPVELTLEVRGHKARIASAGVPRITQAEYRSLRTAAKRKQSVLFIR